MNRYASSPSDDHQPLTWLNGHAIYAAHLIVIIFVASLLMTVLAMFFKFEGALISWLPFTSDRVFKGEVWRLVTYGLVNPPSIPFVVNMFIIGWFGREVERFFGLRIFLTLCGCLYFVTPLLFIPLGLFMPTYLAGESIALAIFVAFATLYPNVPVLFWVLAKWVALTLVGIFTLIALAYHDTLGLISLWVTTGSAYVFVRYQQGVLTFPALPRLGNPFRRKPQFRVLPDLPPETPRVATKATKDDSMAEVDALLDKIARTGLSSLTAQERAKLEKGRESLLKKGPGTR